MIEKEVVEENKEEEERKENFVTHRQTDTKYKMKTENTPYPLHPLGVFFYFGQKIFELFLDETKLSSCQSTLPHCTTMRDRKDVWIYVFVYCIDNFIKGYSSYFYISMKDLRSDINVEINTPREH